MPLPRKTKDLTQVKEAYRDLYSVKKIKENGAEVEYHVLTDIDNHDDVDILRTVRGEAATSRTELQSLKQKLGALEAAGVDVEKYTTTLAENEALKAEKEALATKDQKLIETAVEKRLGHATAGLQLKLNNYEKELGTLKTENETLKKGALERTIDDAALAAFNKVGVQPHVFTPGKYDDGAPDGLSWARRVAVIQDGKVMHKSLGLPLEDVLAQMRDDGERPHWFGGSGGTGSGGSGIGGSSVNNPWSAEHWSPTQQGEIQLKDENRAKQLAAAAGVEVNAAYHPKNGVPKYTFY